MYNQYVIICTCIIFETIKSYVMLCYALSARYTITSKSNFAQLVTIVRNVFDSSLFGYEAGSNGNPMRGRNNCVTVINSYFDFDGS